MSIKASARCWVQEFRAHGFRVGVFEFRGLLFALGSWCAIYPYEVNQAAIFGSPEPLAAKGHPADPVESLESKAEIQESLNPKVPNSKTQTQSFKTRNSKL